jgi:hypothetical protein
MKTLLIHLIKAAVDILIVELIKPLISKWKTKRLKNAKNKKEFDDSFDDLD